MVLVANHKMHLSSIHTGTICRSSAPIARTEMAKPRRSDPEQEIQTALRASRRVMKSSSMRGTKSTGMTRAKKRKAESKPELKIQLQPERPIASSSELVYQNLRILGADFYLIDALDLAPLVLGKFLRRDDVVLQITEVEAYRPSDSACHGRFGLTARTAPVFGAGGHAYVYLCYGLHMMLNIVADKQGVGAAVLIRACAPITGLQTIQQRRGQITDKPVLLTGPGKVGQALGLSTEWSNHPLYEPGGLELLDGPKPETILVGPRVGIEYALPEHVAAPWRFAVGGSPWISAPKNTLRPP